MLKAFVDDSGSEPNDPVFVLAGFLSTPALWSRFADEWSRELGKEPHLEYFKMSEAHAQDGQFRRGWTRPLIAQRVQTLTEIACKYASYRISSVMRWSDYSSYIKEIGDETLEPFNFALRDPYSLCLFGMYIKVAKCLERQKIESDCDYVLDEQSKVGEFAARVINTLGRSGNVELDSIFKSVPIFENDKAVLPLQAADLYAWHLHRWLVTEGGCKQYKKLDDQGAHKTKLP